MIAWIEDENGERVDIHYVPISSDFLPSSAETPLCRMIANAPYYDTVLNEYQIGLMLDELVQSEQVNNSHAELRQLLISAREPHIYVRFVGD